MTRLGHVLRVLTSVPALCLALFAALVWFTIAVRLRAQSQSEQAVPASAKVPARAPQGLVKQLGGKAIELAVPPPPPSEPPKEIPPEVQKTLLAVPRPLSLYPPAPAAAPGPASAPPVSSRYLPFGTLIPCKLVNSVDSNADGTPVVAVVLADMRNLDEQGVSQLVVPAGTLAILESTAPGRERDRIAADGNWVFVWRTRDENNGMELPVNGRALAREFDATTGLYGQGDGRAGLRGIVIENLEAKRINAAAQAAIQGGLAAAKEYDVTSNSLTGQIIRNPLPTLRNALLGSGEAYAQQYADQIRQQVEREGAYVQVRAGTEFYIFPRETVDLRNARRGSMAHNPNVAAAKK